MKLFMVLMKTAAITVYLLCILSFLIPALQPYRQILSIAVALLVAAHALEYAMMKAKMHDAAPGRTDHLLQTLIFGVAHWLPLIRGK